MSNTDVSRRGLLKTSFIGAAAAGAAGFGLTAEAAPARKAAGTYDAVVLGAGPSGLITAITAHDAGAKEILRGETWVLNPYSCSRCWEG